MLSPEKRVLNFEEWEHERFGQLCMKADAYGNFKAALLKLCEKTKKCTFEEVEQIHAAGEQLGEFEKEIYAIQFR